MATGGQSSLPETIDPEPIDPEPIDPEPRDPQPRDPQPSDPMTSLTDCPHCRSLCLGPSVLTCGHVLCRKCLHDVLQLVEAGCPRCEQPLRPAKDKTLTISQLIQQMGTDPVIEHLVLQQLERDGDIRCLNCPNKKAANVCLDCHDYYCEVCSVHHLRGRYAKDHVLRQLPQAVQNASFAACTAPLPSSVVSTSSEDCISNTGDQPSDEISNEESGRVGEWEEWEEWVQKQKGLLQQASSDHQEVITTLRNIVSLGQKLVDKVSTHQQVIDTYHQHLSCLDATQREGPGSYAVKQRGSDVSMDLKTESLEKRLREVMEIHHCPSIDTPKMIVAQLTQLLPPPADADTQNSDSVSKAPEEAAASSTQTSSATPETSATQDATPTPTPTPTPGVDFTSATPEEVFQFSPRISKDKENPFITDIVCLSNRLVLTDLYNSKVKVMMVKPPHALSASITVPETPRRLAVLPDGLVAMTTFKPLIYLMEVTQTSVEVRSQIQTARQYAGIAGLSGGLLVVSSRGYPATVDVVSREGQLIMTLTDSSVELGSPDYLCHSGDQHILVSDWKLHVVHKIDVNSGQVAKTIHHPQMKDPRQVCADSSGNMFVACCQPECVTVRSSDGQWRRLLTVSLHSGLKKAFPQAMCLTGSSHLVVAWAESFSERSSVIICYKFT